MNNDQSTQNKADTPDDLARAATADAAFGDEANPGRSEPSDTERLAEELNQANERVLRAQAELENFRKRMRRDMEEERRYAAMPLIADLLPIIDNFERAIESGEKNQAGDDLVQGVKMVQAQFLAVLDRHNCRRIGNVGEAFDPNFHQAIAQEASSEHPAGTITRVTQYGYQLHDRVVRPAQVMVSTGPANQ